MAKEIVREDLDRVEELLGQVLGRADYAGIERMGGLTNRTYKVSFEDRELYVVRKIGRAHV